MAKSNGKAVTVNKGGRPSVITDDIVRKLVDAFRQGTTVETALNYAGLATRTFYDNYNQNESFRNKINEAKEYSRLAAGNVVMQDIVKNKSVDTAKWWLEKKYRKEFGKEDPQTLIQQNFNQPENNKEFDDDDLKRFEARPAEEV